MNAQPGLGRRVQLAPLHLFSAVTLVAAAAGCSPGQGNPPSSGVQDDAGRTLSGDRPARRVVSLVPSLNELIVALNRGDRLVGRTRYDTSPALAHLPVVGGSTDPNLEVLTTLDPDLVVFWADEGNPALARRIEAVGVRVYTARIMELDDFRRHARNLAVLLGAEESADSLLDAMDRRLEVLSERIPDEPRPEVMLVVWHDPPATAGPGSFVDEIIRRAGGVNAFADAPLPWPQVSMESVVQRDPDVILVPWDLHGDADDEHRFWTDSPWSRLSAVRSGRVLLVPDRWFARPGLGNVDAVGLLARHLHPEAFQGAEP